MCRKGEPQLPGSPFKPRRLTEHKIYCRGKLEPVLTTGCGFFYCACGRPVRIVT